MREMREYDGEHAMKPEWRDQKPSWKLPEVETPWSDPNHDVASDLRDFAQKSHDSWPLPPDPQFDISQWIPWQHVPSCPCFQCEDFRRDNGLSCMYGLGPRPEEPPRHNWEGQAMFASAWENRQVDSPDSAPETESGS